MINVPGAPTRRKNERPSPTTDFPYPVELTVTVNSSMRNNAAAATLAAQYFPSEVVFSPSVSPLFSQLTSSLAVRALQKRQQKIDHPAS